MLTTLTTIHVIICIVLTLTVLLQFGKGAEIGAVMGGGASQNVFTSSGKGNFFTKLTTVLAIAFMVNSLVLTKLYSQENSDSVLSDSAPVAESIKDTTVEDNQDTTKKDGAQKPSVNSVEKETSTK